MRELRYGARTAGAILFWTLSVAGVVAQQPLPPAGERSSLERLDVPYAGLSPAQKLDLFLPATGTGPFPLVVWVHGGAWSGGDKRLQPDGPQRRVLERGYALASVNYRLSGEAVFPAQIQDVKAAIRWLRANSGRLRLDPDRFAAWGGSAGGHLVALLGGSGASRPLDAPELGHPEVSSRVQAVLAWYPATDFLQMDGQLAASGCPLYEGKGHDASTSPPSRLLGGGITQLPDQVRLANPIDYISPDDPPILIQHGTADCTVPYQQSEVYWRALVPVLGSPHARLTLIDGAKHGQADFSTPANLDVVFRFLDTYLK